LNAEFKRFFNPQIICAAVATTVSLASFLYLLNKDLVVIHTDSLGHLNTARKIIFGNPPGLGQLGGIWLPLQHLLMLPFIWIDRLYYSGAAGSILSMISYVGACIFLYKLIFKLTANWQASALGVLVFAANPNVLIYQAAPMMELIFFFTLIAGVYYFYLFEKAGNWQNLAKSAIFMLFSAVIRFEAWSVILFLTLAVILTIFRRSANFAKIGAFAFYFFSVSFFGVAVWLIFLAAVLGNPLFFLTSQYSPSVYVELAQFGGIAGVTIVKNPLDAARFTLSVLIANSTLLVFILGCVGLGLFLVKNKLKNLSLLSLIVPSFFYIFLVSAHQLLIFYDRNTSYQVRYGMFILISAGVFIGFLVNSTSNFLKSLSIYGLKKFLQFAKSRSRKRFMVILPSILVATVVATSYTLMIKNNQVVTLNESRIATLPTAREINLRKAGEWFSTHYDGGRVLMALFQNEEVLFYSKVPTGNFIHEGSQELFDLALSDPVKHVDWVVTVSAGFVDLVTERLANPAILEKHFELVYEGACSRIYKKRV
jgi:hypothetical protein